MKLRWVHGVVAVVVVALVGGLVALAVLADSPAAPPSSSHAPSNFTPATGLTDLTPTATTQPPGQSTEPGVTFRPCRPPRRTSLTVLTLNIHGAVARDNSYQLALLAEELRAWDADVILLQEVHRYRAKSDFEDQPLQLAARLDMFVSFGRNFTRPAESAATPRRESGTAILSRLPILATGNAPLPNRPGLQPRGLARIVVELNGEPVDIYNTHLQHTAGNIRLVQTRGIRTFIRAQTKRPLLIGGDFNATPDSAAMAVMSRFTTDVWPESGTGSGLTVPPRAPKRRIDFLLYNGAWEPITSEVLTSAVADHRAVRTTFELTRELPC